MINEAKDLAPLPTSLFTAMQRVEHFRQLYAYDDPLEFFKPWVESYLKPYIPASMQNSEVVANNLHTIAFGITLYTLLFQVSKLLLLFPGIYNPLKNTKNRLDMCVRVVSFIQAIIICVLGIPIFNNQYLNQDHVFASTPYSKFYTSMALSYFIWDTIVSTIYVKFFGVGFLVHGIVSTIVFWIAVDYTFIQYYSATFLLFEISTPFLDIRWVGLKFDVLSETVKLINNIILILIFFFIRICWGWYQVGRLGIDLYAARNSEGFTTTGAIIILTCNSVLDILNVYWFTKMMIVAIETLKKMFGYEQNDDKIKLM